MNDPRIESITDILKKYPIIFAYLFGSRAKGESNRLSDIDLAALIDRKTSRSERFDIRLRLINDLSAIAGTKVDLIVMNDIPVQLAYEVIKHGKVILCKDRNAMIDSEYRDTIKISRQKILRQKKGRIVFEKNRNRGHNTRMTLNEKVADKLDRLKEYVGYLKDYQKYALNDLTRDPTLRGAVERYLHLSAECVIDIAEVYRHLKQGIANF